MTTEIWILTILVPFELTNMLALWQGMKTSIFLCHQSLHLCHSLSESEAMGIWTLVSQPLFPHDTCEECSQCKTPPQEVSRSLTPHYSSSSFFSCPRNHIYMQISVRDIIIKIV